MEFSSNRRVTALSALALGILSAFAFQPVGWWPLMPLAIAGLAALISRAGSMKTALLVGWLFGLGQFTIGLNWIATAFTFQAAMPAWLGWIAVLLLSLYLAIFPMLSAGLAWRFGKGRPLALVLALAGSWPLTEWLRAKMFTGFAWNPLGVTLVDTPWLGASPVIGTYGLSLLVVLLGGLIWLLTRRQWKSAAGIAVAALVLLAIPSEAPVAQKPGDVRIVQPNIGQADKWREGFEAIAAGRLTELSRQPPGQTPVADTIFWPEAAVTEPLVDERPAAAPFVASERLRTVRALSPGQLLATGGIAYTSSDGVGVDGATNSVFVLNSSGQIVGRYDKAHLVPYGEYLPMRPLLSAIGLSRLAPGDLDFRPGPGPRTLALPDGRKMGVQICYEIIFSGEVIDRADRPDYLFNPSNDAWFGAWGPPQHLAQARLRAAEEGIPVIRSTPTGISALVDAKGALLGTVAAGSADAIEAAIPAPTRPTLFSRVGNAIPLLLGAVLLIAAIALGRRGRYSDI